MENLRFCCFYLETEEKAVVDCLGDFLGLTYNYTLFRDRSKSAPSR
jgi:hypothetical protein